jgi:hypothetical protein
MKTWVMENGQNWMKMMSKLLISLKCVVSNKRIKREKLIFESSNKCLDKLKDCGEMNIKVEYVNHEKDELDFNLMDDLSLEINFCLWRLHIKILRKYYKYR